MRYVIILPVHRRVNGRLKTLRQLIAAGIEKEYSHFTVGQPPSLGAAVNGQRVSGSRCPRNYLVLSAAGAGTTTVGHVVRAIHPIKRTARVVLVVGPRSEEHTSELQSL